MEGLEINRTRALRIFFGVAWRYIAMAIVLSMVVVTLTAVFSLIGQASGLPMTLGYEMIRVITYIGHLVLLYFALFFALRGEYGEFQVVLAPHAPFQTPLPVMPDLPGGNEQNESQPGQ